MSASIVFYDIPSTLPNKCWSPNLWKTRYALNFKGIPYKTVWVEYPEIEALCKQIGAAPTRNKPDGRPHFTLPVIHDLSTGAVISDSTKIAAYLDTTYPEKPVLMPAGTAGFHRAFEDAAHALIAPIYPYGLPASHTKLNPLSAEYFRRTREESWGKTLENLAPQGDEDAIEWKKLKDGFGKIDEWMRASGEGSLYVMGDAPCYADMWMAGYALWIKLVLPDKWEEIQTWHQGRWAKLLKSLEEYETVV
ncbi:Glutathione S-transferase-like protein ustS [Mycena venus]|uniref:Glutathione S-transferase-like protein ustS n=1 Tax=Mycena venus TaxID=2733690 RepID=A0A8H6YCA5_9AGAR|nr:Glutathione S-transferase-like protein ustS [Mycena venus]